MHQRGTFYQTRPAAVLFLTGEDAADFLQGQGTAAVPAIGGVAYTLFLDHKGMLKADGHLLRLEEERFLLASLGTPSDVLQHCLERNIIADDVELHDATDQYTLIVAADEPFEGSSWEQVDGQANTYRFQGRAWGPETVLSLLPVGTGLPFAGDSIAESKANALRLQAGTAWVGTELAGKANPLEAGLASAIAFDKGCYLGQEVIARMHRLGRKTRQLCTFSAPSGQCSAGTELQMEGKAVGEIIAADATSGTLHGLVLVKAKADLEALIVACGWETLSVIDD